MALLPSGLPDHVADDEDLSRFLTQSSHYNRIMARPAAFLPNPKHRNASVFRIGNDLERLRQTWDTNNQAQRTLKSIALFKASDVRATGLEVIPEEPPAAHANIIGWPWLENDPELQRASHLEMASQIASKTNVMILS